MGNANAGGWRYTACYGWNWRSARAISSALVSLALPMPSWFRAVVARCLLTRTALHADAQGIWGSAGPLSAGSVGPCPWKDVTDIVVWEYDHLRIIGIARRGDTVDGGPAARALASHTPQQSRPTRRRALRRHPSYPAFIAPDGSPYDAGNVVTANGWCVDTARLQATVRHFAPRARFVDLSGVSAVPDSGGPFGSLRGSRWLDRTHRVAAPWLAARRCRLGRRPGRRGRQSRHPKPRPVRRDRRCAGPCPVHLARGGRPPSAAPLWAPGDLARVRPRGRGKLAADAASPGRLAAWTLRVSSLAGWRGRQGTGTSGRRSPYAIRRGR